MSAILVTPQEIREVDGHLALVVEVKQWEGKIRGPTKTVVIGMPIYEDDMIRFLKGLCAATTVIFQHTYLIEVDDLEGRKILVVP